MQGNSGWAFPGSGSSVRNSYDLAAEHSVDVTDTPHSLVVNYNYELPFGTFLGMAALLVVFFGTPFVNWYQSLLTGR